MARVLIVPCGCRGRALAAELSAAGHVVRGTTRDPANADAIAAAGAEPYVGDPDRIGTLMGALAGTTVVCWLMGSIAIDPGRVRMLFERLVDTPVRGFAYEAVGDVPDRLLSAGRDAVARAAETWRIPVTTFESPRNETGWTAASADRVSGLVGADAAG